MLNDEMKAELIGAQIVSLRAELVEYAKVVHQAIFGWLALSGVMAGTLWNSQVVPNADTRALLTFAGAQVQVFVALAVVAATANQRVHAGAIAALEQRLNELCGERLLVWDLRIAPRYLFSWKSEFAWTLAAMTTMLVGNFMLLLLAANASYNNAWSWTLIGLELTGLAVLVTRTLSTTSRVQDFARDEMRATTAVVGTERIRVDAPSAG